MWRWHQIIPTVVERRLLAVTDRLRLSPPADWIALRPVDRPVPFTTADLASAIGRPRRTAQQMAYCLREMGALEVVGKRGNAFEYRATSGP